MSLAIKFLRVHYNYWNVFAVAVSLYCTQQFHWQLPATVINIIIAEAGCHLSVHYA